LVEKFDVKQYCVALNSLLSANGEGLLRSCHYVGLGGLATSVSRMSFKNSVGCYLRGISEDLLFSENLSFVVEVSKEKSGSFQETLKENKTPFSFVGETNNTNKVVFDNHIDVNISLAKDIWVNSLRERLQS